MTMMYEHVGGEQPLRNLAAHFHEAVLADELLGKLFLYGMSHHVDHLTAFLVEIMGGPSRYSDELGGFEAIFKAHQRLKISDAQRARFVELMMASADAVGLPADARFRKAFERQVARAAGLSARVSHGELDHLAAAPYPELGRWEW
ncbi:globin [Actinomadura sp. NBRC 104425]|uniref:group II truncated hemoglobin n=1 Tax=Actinomadura sp. NBRC 104425 TaxID=3032204 RepID=UPI0024A2B98E|nr:group II truncated hemoglobin [Actinomadura sp. NBRC 104425]GLZ15914.1 globin [Actinomadura sp. NBRC 104425]